MLPLLLLLSSISVAVSGNGRTANDCTDGDKWTDKYIRFECFQGKGVKGVRAIGCVPANNEKGAMIKTGATFDEKHFTYSCSKTGDVFSYQIIHCRDATGKKLAVNENRTMTDGAIWKCYKDKAGAVKVSLDKADGCLFGGVKYAVGKTWVQPMEFKATLKSSGKKLIGKAVRMECKKSGAEFVGAAVGCVTPAGKTIYNGKYIVEDKMNIKCNITKEGKTTMTDVDDKEVACDYKGTVVKNGEKYTTPDGVDVYLCIFKILKKISCNIYGKPYSADTIAHIESEIFYCNKGPGFVDFGDITGCTLSNGKKGTVVKPFYSKWINGTEIHRCYFSIKKGTVSKPKAKPAPGAKKAAAKSGTVSPVTPYVAFWKCAYNDMEFHKYTVYTDGVKVYKRCSWLEKFWGMRDMTAQEIADFKAKRKPKAGASDIFGGAGGGSGGQITAELEEEPEETETPPEEESEDKHDPEEPGKPSKTKTKNARGSPKIPVKPPLSVVPGKIAKTQDSSVKGPAKTSAKKALPINTGASKTKNPAVQGSANLPKARSPSVSDPKAKTLPRIEDPAVIVTKNHKQSVSKDMSLSLDGARAPSSAVAAKLPKNQASSIPESEKPPKAQIPAISRSISSAIAQPLPVAKDKCVDLFTLCTSIGPICTAPPQSTVMNLKEIVKKTNVTVDQIKEIFNLMGFDGIDPSDAKKKEEIDEVIRDLIDSSDSMDVNDCAGWKSRRPACKRCQIFKKKLHDVMLMVCPATCRSCDKAGKLPTIIKDLVRFYCSECR